MAECQGQLWSKGKDGYVVLCSPQGTDGRYTFLLSPVDIEQKLPLHLLLEEELGKTEHLLRDTEQSSVLIQLGCYHQVLQMEQFTNNRELRCSRFSREGSPGLRTNRLVAGEASFVSQRLPVFFSLYQVGSFYPSFLPHPLPLVLPGSAPRTPFPSVLCPI